MSNPEHLQIRTQLMDYNVNEVEHDGADLSQDNVHPEDSASQVGGFNSQVGSQSGVSGPSNFTVRSRASSRAASLAIIANSLEERQQLELEELRIRQRKEALEVKTRLAVAEAQAHAAESGRSRVSLRSTRETLGLNGAAPEFRPTKATSLVSRRDKPRDFLTKPRDEIVIVDTSPRDFLKEPRDENVDSMTMHDVRPISVHTNSVNDVVEALRLSQQQMLNAVHMPQAELTHFTGDPLKYWVFIRAFESRIEAATSDENAKLILLVQHCDGKAKELIEPCICMPAGRGYRRARELLKQRFGDDYTISQAWVKKVSEGPEILPKDYVKLREFSDDLNSCVDTLEAMGYIAEISTQRVMVAILSRLPMFLRTRWVREVQLRKGRGDRPHDVIDLARFIEFAAEESNDPVYSELLGGKRETKSNPTSKRHHGTFMSDNANVGAAPPSVKFNARDGAAPPGVKCDLCEGFHTLFGCDKFKGMSVSDRRTYAFEKRLCFNCLKSGHISTSCKLERVCSVDGCKKKHTKFLHPVGRSEVKSSGPSSGPSVSCHATSRGGSRLALPIVSVKVRPPGGGLEYQTYALLDNGSTTTFCTDGLVDSIGVEGKEESLIISTIDRPGRHVETRSVAFEISSLDGSEFSELSSVYTRSTIPCSTSHIPHRSDISGFDHLKDVHIPDVDAEQVTVLIGQDNSDLMMPLEVRRGRQKGMPYAVRTKLGWVVNGAIGENCNGSFVNFVDCGLEEQLEKFWKVEGWELLNGPELSMSVEDERTLSLWNQSVSQDSEGHFVLPIPFRGKAELPESRPQAEKRLLSLRSRLVKDPVLCGSYVDGMADLLQKGYAEEVKVEDSVDGPVWYLPHHPVVSPKKVRIVFDCAAQVNGVSLNKCVMQGPDMTNDLAGVLHRFRLGPVAVQGDIEAMFHQVKVPARDRDALRFLWYQDGNLDSEIMEFRMTSHLFGGTWSPACCGFALRLVADKPGFSQVAMDTVRDNFYVDDCLKAVDTPEEAITLIKDLRGMLADGGFHITKFASNSKQVLESVPVEERAKGIRPLNLGSDSLPFEKALGLTWDLKEDVLTFLASVKDKPFTRRGLLSSVSSLFDPLGLVSPFTVRGRMLVQELTRLSLGWDEEIPVHIAQQWRDWLSELAAVSDFKIDRCIKPTGSAEFQLHHFGDASTRAYGSVSYLRVTLSDGQIVTFLVMSRSRLAPMKELSIPRLELSAAVLAVKMDSMLRRELGLNVTRSVFWSDSMVVLGYISNPMVRYHTFVANRVSAVHAGSESDQWRHVASADNPADMISRGIPVRELNQSSLWMHGPSFLKGPVEDWPGHIVPTCAPSSEDPEVKKVHPVFLNAENDMLDDFICYHSSLLVVKRRIALLLRVKEWLRQKVAGKECPDIRKPVSVEELDLAEIALVQCVQRREFPSYLGKELPVKGSLSPLTPRVNSDGLLVVGGRVSKGDLPEKMKHPVILPKDHHLTDLIVRETHLQNGHVGREHVLSLVRERYWVIRGRVAVRRVLAKCTVCKRWNAKPSTQLMGDLPEGRIDKSCPPFTNVGIDFFGPFMVKRGRSVQKRYGCLFTCMSVRAIHLEVSFSLDTDSFIHCLHRFMSRRGCPKQIFCDNGTNFVGAEGQLKDLLVSLDQGKIQAALVPKKVGWNFNPPSASHMGGVWERLVKSVKKVLNPMLSQQSLEDEGLATLMCIVESILNSRPLTKVSEDSNDLEALTPNHLLIPGTLSYSYPEGEFRHEDNYVRRRWRQVQYHADVFWRRWLREYMPILQSRSKWQVIQRNLQVNDLVILVEETPRSQWPLAKVIETYPGDDGKVRKVRIRTKSTELVRPITKLCMLEEA